MPDRITIETETPGDFRSMFRLLIDDKVIGEGLSAVQAHILIGDILCAPTEWFRTLRRFEKATDGR